MASSGFTPRQGFHGKPRPFLLKGSDNLLNRPAVYLCTCRWQSIVLATAASRVAVFPLTLKQLKNTHKMTVSYHYSHSQFRAAAHTKHSASLPVAASTA